MVDSAETLSGELSGEAFLRDFKTAVEMAQTVDTFQSWVLAGAARAELVEQVRENPIVAEEQLAADGLAALLSSAAEKQRIQELVEKARRLDITRFLGYNATVSAHDVGPIIKYAVANPIATGMRYLRGGPIFRKQKTAELTSLSPADQSFRIGEFRRLGIPWRFTAFWEVYPFNPETGEPVVNVSLQGPREKLPSREYQLWWDANRA